MIQALARSRRRPPRNGRARRLDRRQADAIVAAAAAGRGGEHDDQFPIDVFQTGSGTSSNMNIQRGHRLARGPAPASRSTPTTMSTPGSRSNDTFPTAIHVAARWPGRRPAPGARPSRDALEAKADEFAHLVKSGRTHLMDATPVMLGQEFGGYAARSRSPPSGSRRCCPGCASCRSAALRSAPASTRRPGSPRAVIERLAADRAAVHRGPRPLRGAGHP